MELTILGCWAPYPAPEGACPSYLLKTQEGYFLLDCGNGALGKLQKHINFRELRGVVISHLHPDHYFDLFSLRHAIEGSLRDGSRKDKLKIFLPSQPKEAFLKVYNFKQAFEVVAIETIPVNGELAKGVEVRTWQCNDLTVEFLQTKHPLITYAMNFIESSGQSLKKFSYSSDTSYKKELAQFFKGANLLLCEASLQEAHKELTKLGHLTAKEAGLLAWEAEAKDIIITHFWPEFDLTISQAEAESTFKKVVNIANNDDKYKI